MFNQRVPSDIVKAVFHYLGKCEFSANMPKIHKAFYEIYKRSEFSKLFNDMVFDTSKVFLYSPTIRYALDRLQKSDLLLCNMLSDSYEVPDVLAKSPDIKELFSEAERNLLQKSSQIF